MIGGEMKKLSKMFSGLVAVIRSALGGMAVDAKSGSVIQAAEGLAIWPNLKYTLPSK
jgi:hypothetical protein